MRAPPAATTGRGSSDLGLTSGLFAVLVVGLALLLPLVVLSLWRCTPREPVTRAVQRWALVVLAQGSAVLAVLVMINNQYGLYSSWDDLLGRPSTSGTSISAPQPTRPGQSGGPPTRSRTPPVMPWVNGAPTGFTTYGDSSTFQAKVAIPGSGGASGPVVVEVPVGAENVIQAVSAAWKQVAERSEMILLRVLATRLPVRHAPVRVCALVHA